MTSLKKAAEIANLIGAPRPLGRKRLTFNQANYDKVKPLFAAGVSQREVARQTGISKGSVSRLHAYWLSHGMPQ